MSKIVNLKRRKTNGQEEVVYPMTTAEAVIGLGSSENIDLTDYAKKEEIPTKVSQLSNDRKYLRPVDFKTIHGKELIIDPSLNDTSDIVLTGEEIKITNGETGEPVLQTSDESTVIIYDNDSLYTAFEQVISGFDFVNSDIGKIPVVTKVSQLENDKNYIENSGIDGIEINTDKDIFLNSNGDGNVALAGGSGAYIILNSSTNVSQGQPNVEIMGNVIKTSGTLVDTNNNEYITDSYLSDKEFYITDSMIDIYTIDSEGTISLEDYNKMLKATNIYYQEGNSSSSSITRPAFEIELVYKYGYITLLFMFYGTGIQISKIIIYKESLTMMVTEVLTVVDF